MPRPQSVSISAAVVESCALVYVGVDIFKVILKRSYDASEITVVQRVKDFAVGVYGQRNTNFVPLLHRSLTRF